jgi:streptogramin lyase
LRLDVAAFPSDDCATTMRSFTFGTLALCLLVWTSACEKRSSEPRRDGAAFLADASDSAFSSADTADSGSDDTRGGANADGPGTSDRANDGTIGALDAAGAEAGADAGTGTTDGSARTDGSAAEANGTAFDAAFFDGRDARNSADVPVGTDSSDAAGAGDARDAVDLGVEAGSLENLPIETHDIVEFFIPDLGIIRAMPDRIAAGPDGNMWFTSSNRNSVSRITVDGTVTEFPIPTGSYVTNTSSPGDLVLGPDANLWFRESKKLAHIDMQGVITEMAIPAPAGAAQAIMFGPDGAIWFTEGNAIARLTLDGSLTEYPVPLISNADSTYGESPSGITMGPDGNIWFADSGGPDIGRMTLTGTITQFRSQLHLPLPNQIVAGGGGNLWVTGYGCLGRISTSGSMILLQTPGADQLQRISASPDGTVWIPIENLSGGYIIRISPTGAMTKLPFPTKSGAPTQVAVGPDGKIWFTEEGSDKVGYFLP